MSAKGLIIPSILFLAAVLTRLPFTSETLYNLDSVQFALGTEDFDVSLHQPQPPGYFIYVMLGRLARMASGDPNTALVALSILFSGLTAVMLYYLGREVFDEETGLSAAIMGITSPLIWFHGEVALSYLPEAFMSVLFAYVCHRLLRGEARLYWLAALTLAVAGGIRQNTMVFLFPLWLYSIKGLGIRRVLLGFLIFGAAALAWYIPMVEATGGYARYSAALESHWNDAGWHGITLRWIAFNAEYMSFFIFSGLALALAPVLAYIFSVLKRLPSNFDKKTAAFFIFWLLPAFLFHLIIFTHPAVPGHSLIYLVGLTVLAARALTAITVRPQDEAGFIQGRGIKTALLSSVAAGNALIFVFFPSPISAGGIREHDRALNGYIQAVRDNFAPLDTEILATDRFLYSHRHAMYYLPEFKVHDTVLLTTPDGPRLFWSKDRKTYQARYISPLPRTRRFVYFLNFGPGGEIGLPEEAKPVSAGNGRFLVYFDDAQGLRNVDRVAGLIDPALKGKKKTR